MLRIFGNISGVPIPLIAYRGVVFGFHVHFGMYPEAGGSRKSFQN
jgi:hypothetical protein